MYSTDEDLECDIKHYSNLVLYLTEIKETRARNLHGILRSTVIRKTKKFKFAGIASVTCKCGHVTTYKKPLMNLNDFECPKAVGR